MDGVLNVYFPGRIKNRGTIKRFCKKWNRVREKQLRYLHNGHRPLSDLLDLSEIRLENDSLLNDLRESLHLKGCSLCEYPYATECMRAEYERIRESKIHSKEINVVLSKFSVRMQQAEVNRKTIDGILQMHFNADSCICTFVMSLSLVNFSSKEIISLKHCFYKRFEIEIQELGLSLNTQGCNNANIYGCMSIGGNGEKKPHYIRTTFQEFVYRHLPFQVSDIDNEFDFRARYSMLEVWKGSALSDNEKYGILTADEGFTQVPNSKVKRVISNRLNLSERTSFEIFYMNLNALIINVCCDGDQKYFDGFAVPLYHNKYRQYDCPLNTKCIAGIRKGVYPQFLKGVEIHYMTNMAYTDDIEVRDQSFLRPWIFLNRAMKLWRILYEVDLHNAHKDENVWKSFGINKQLLDIRTEYNTILTHIIGYFTCALTLVMFIMTVIQVCK